MYQVQWQTVAVAGAAGATTAAKSALVPHLQTAVLTAHSRNGIRIAQVCTHNH